jgi:hypothetical protein
MKIISGGQTGVDRAALDVALKHGIDCGGWCPAGRLAEDGTIPARYPLRELPDGSFTDRTWQNVNDSDATVIFCNGALRGGTAETIRCCEELNRPHLVIDATETTGRNAVAALAHLVREHSVDALNVAGPRASEWPTGYAFASGVLEQFLSDWTVA